MAALLDAGGLARRSGHAVEVPHDDAALPRLRDEAPQLTYVPSSTFLLHFAPRAYRCLETRLETPASLSLYILYIFRIVELAEMEDEESPATRPKYLCNF